MKKQALLVATTLLLSACQLPRTTTSDERAWAYVTINKVIIAITALQATGNIEPEAAERALSQLNDLREKVDSSATHAVSWVEIVDTLTTIALQWAIPLPPKGR